jgi:hypothetical protein
MKMDIRGRKALGLALLMCSAVCGAQEPRSQAHPQLTPQQTALIQKASAQEKFVVKVVQQYVPLVQTYLQHMQADPKSDRIPESDWYMLGRVRFDRIFNDSLYEKKAPKKGMFAGSARFLGSLTKAFSIQYSANGFMDMMFLDHSDFDLQHYDFTFVRKEFLGDVHTMVFDIQPKPHLGPGRFIGRAWIEDDGGNVVRFTGTFSGTSKTSFYFHFDSWRGNVQQNVWLPMAIYVQEQTRSERSDQDQDFRLQTYFWGYGLKLPADNSTDNESVVVENAVDNSDSGENLSPLQAERHWKNQSEQNVLDRLTQAGLLANPSDFDDVLETVTNNLIMGSKLSLLSPIHCRVMLASTLESINIGNTIILSKGLIDVLPNEENLAAALSFQLAHLALGHEIDTRYAFSDRLLFPDESTLQRIYMNHSQAQNEEAAREAVKIFRSSVYQDKVANVRLFYQQLTQVAPKLPALLTPRLGDSLLGPDGQPWMADLGKGAPTLQVDNLEQIAALPLGSRLKIEPWSDKVVQLHVHPEPLLSARDKMPFQVTPIFFRLTRYQPPAAAAGATNATTVAPR